jgi:hypothetical protein
VNEVGILVLDYWPCRLSELPNPAVALAVVTC